MIEAQVKLGPQTREVSCLVDIGSDLTIDVLLGLDSGLNKVDVGKKEACIKAQHLVFQVQADQPKELKDQLEQVKPSSRPYNPGLAKF